MAEQQVSPAGAPAASVSSDELQRLIAQTAGELGPMIEREEDESKRLVDDFVSVVLQGKLVKGDVIKRINQAIAWLDKRLTDQVNAIIHHPDFRTLEGAWRGLKYLVDRKPPGQHLQITVLNIGKKELSGVMEKYDADSGQTGWTQSPIFRAVFRDRFNMPGGNPFGCLVGDYQFDKSKPDVELLARMAQVCGAAQAPFISAASSNLLGLKSFQDMPDIAELDARMTTPDYSAWNSLRQSDDSRFLVLTLPRMLARIPYGEGKTSEGAFKFEEDLRPVDGAEWSARETKHDNYVWANAAYAMVANIANTFHDTGWTTAIRGVESGGKVEGLPIDTFKTDSGGIDSKCPTEVAIDQSREAELGNLGFIPLCHWQNTDFAAFVGAQTVQKPQKYETDLATANAELSARLPYVLMISRFAHYLKKMLFEWVGTNKNRDQLEQELNEWVMLYATSAMSAEDVKQRKPLEEAKIVVKEIAGKPGYFEAFAYLKPHIQLEAVTVNLGVVSKVPK